MLWDNLELRGAKEVLILIYTGFRASEFLQIKKENIDFLNWTIRGGLKTEAGKDRLVPIHSKILELVKNRVDSNNEYLIVNFKGE